MQFLKFGSYLAIIGFAALQTAAMPKPMPVPSADDEFLPGVSFDMDKYAGERRD
ncbi:hypothetical protein POSPLADRAFT_1057079 [Postia placenta MAD-698-R-SB12]|uniref:Uncharacterized protein n=1 Tax=Postia placenta MAD-698-R-SB12 TaxID=670580 RepID=A0A1X6N1H1_9APHY|nr:hypothetical protein POSPLADRAFT_1057079 [Postia placenta MAD-698-R-SB12]OSX62465.1 hypothetical protein POSPLADRAFT_1057079 [Postia placenta MAD-698-R-SB12]